MRNHYYVTTQHERTVKRVKLVRSMKDISDWCNPCTA